MFYGCTHPHCDEFSTKKCHDPRDPPFIFTGSHPERLVFVSRDEKVLKGKRFADVEEVKQKMAEARKDGKIDGLKRRFEQRNKALDGSLASSGGHFEGDPSLNM